MWKGKPILGAISGFMFGLFLGPTLWLWGVIPFHSPMMWILPIVGIVLGLVMAAWAPFGRGRAAPASSPAADTPAQVDAAADSSQE
jgi:type VI protein secretion system component VasK